MEKIKLNNYIIETEVVDEIKKVMRRTRKIIPEIKENDKTISWDGELIIFSEDKNNQQTAKDNFSKRIPVQVKGTQVNNFSNNFCKHSIEVTDLKNYYKDGGVIYFKGEVLVKNEEEYEIKLFYKVLLPIDIKEILDKKDEQKTIVQKLLKFPKGNGKIIPILEKFMKDRELQSTYLLESNSKKLHEFDKIMISAKNIDIKLDNILEESFYVYGVENGNITIPLGSIMFDKKIEPTNAVVSIDNKIYFNGVNRITKSDGSVTLSFGSNIKFIYKNKDKSIKFNFNIVGNDLNLIIKTLEFLIDFKNKKYFHINGIKLEAATFTFKSIGNLEEELTYVVALNDLLNYFKIHLNISIKEFSLAYLNNIVAIRNSIIFDNNMSKNKLNEGLYQLSLDIGNSKILLFVHKDGNSTKYEDFYNISNNYSIHYNQNDIENSKITPFLSLKSDELLHINFNKDKILKSIKEYTLTEESTELLNDFILELIKSFDKSQKEEYLILSLEIIKYIENNNFYNDIILINYLQILIRKNENIKDFYPKLFELRNTEDLLIKCCSLILTESYTEFEYYFNMLDVETKNHFETFPIYKLYQDK